MRSRALPLAVVVVATASLVGLAPAADIPALVARLSADDYRERERAGAALLALGYQAVPDLKAALAKSADPEATRRLEVLVERLESAGFAQPTRITLKVERKRPRKSSTNSPGCLAPRSRSPTPRAVPSSPSTGVAPRSSKSSTNSATR